MVYTSNPDDLTLEGQRVYDKALSGDIIRADEASAIFEDARGPS